MTKDEINEMLDNYKEEIEKDIADGMSFLDISLKYAHKAQQDMFPKSFIVVMKVHTPDFATEEHTAEMICKKYPFSEVIAITETDGDTLVEINFHHLETKNEKVN